MAAEKDIDWASVSSLLHFSDSVLPVGAYAHSFGLEGMIQLGIVHDETSLHTFLVRDVLDSLKYVELPLFRLSYEAVENADLALVHELDNLSYALRPTKQLRTAASSIGKQMLKIYQSTWGKTHEIPVLKYHQSPVVLGHIFANHHVPINAGLSSIAYQTYSALLQASLKLLPIGPAASQRLIHCAMAEIEAHLPEIKRLELEDVGNFNPLWDIAASRHEHTNARLFIS